MRHNRYFQLNINIELKQIVKISVNEARVQITMKFPREAKPKPKPCSTQTFKWMRSFLLADYEFCWKVFEITYGYMRCDDRAKYQSRKSSTNSMEKLNYVSSTDNCRMMSCMDDDETSRRRYVYKSIIFYFYLPRK